MLFGKTKLEMVAPEKALPGRDDAMPVPDAPVSYTHLTLPTILRV